MDNKMQLEGILSMLEEIKENTKNNPALDKINAKLEKIESTCNTLANQKLVTEDLLADFFAHMLNQMNIANTKQDQEISQLRHYISAHHKYVKEQIAPKQDHTNATLERIESLLKENQEKRGLFTRLERWANNILNF